MLLKLREMNLKNTVTNWMFFKKLIRILNKNTFGRSIVSLFKKCKILNIYQTCEFKIVCQSLPTTRYSHFNFPLPQSTSVIGRTEFQVAKMWNSLLINLRAVSDPMGGSWGEPKLIYLCERRVPSPDELEC